MRSCTAARAVLAAFVLIGLSAAPALADRPPNVVIIFTDDQGYGDVGVYGAQGFETPHLDRMAAEGARFTDFYVASSACSASRAALLTGSYPPRVGIPWVLNPRSDIGLNPEETTIADMLKTQDYATAMYGKWHLGHHAEFLPTRQGFDEYVGIPYSNDMWPHHPAGPDRFPELPLLEGEQVINSAVQPEDQEQFTTQFTEMTVEFIERHQDEPFFVYLAHPMPHVPLYVSDKFRGASEQGLYGDVIMEIDWSVGQIMQTLEELELAEDTLVFFTSDNGPWLVYGDHAGSSGPLREGKGTAWDGGHRVPALAWSPGSIPEGTVVREPVMSIDILPTLAHLSGADLPERPIDGKNVWPLFVGEDGAESPHEAYFFYRGRRLEAVRSGQWKLHVPHRYRTVEEMGGDGLPGEYTQARTELALFDLTNDIGQQVNLVEQYPQVVQRLQDLLDQARQEIGDALTDTEGAGVRPPGRIESSDD